MSLFRTASRTVPGSIVSAKAFERFYEGAHLGIFRYLMVLCGGNQSEAEEITAQAFLRAWEKREQFSGEEPAAFGWVTAIARNLLIDRRRSEGAHPVDAILDDVLVDDGAPIEDILVNGERLQAVLALLQRLPLIQRDILALRFLCDWRVKTIAEHLGMTENTVSVNLRRALAKLHRELVSHDLAGQNTSEGRVA